MTELNDETRELDEVPLHSHTRSAGRGSNVLPPAQRLHEGRPLAPAAVPAAPPLHTQPQTPRCGTCFEPLAENHECVLCPGCHLPALYSDRYCGDCKEFGTPKQRGEAR